MYERCVKLTEIYCDILRMGGKINPCTFSFPPIPLLDIEDKVKIVYKELEMTFKNIIEYDEFLWKKHFNDSLTFTDIKNSECVVGFHLYKEFFINLFSINFDEMLITSRILENDNCIKYVQDSKKLKLNKKLKKVRESK